MDILCFTLDMLCLTMKVTASLTAVPTKLVHFLTDDLSLRCTGNDPRKVRNFSTKSWSKYYFQVIQSVTFWSKHWVGHQQPFQKVTFLPSQKGHKELNHQVLNVDVWRFFLKQLSTSISDPWWIFLMESRGVLETSCRSWQPTPPQKLRHFPLHLVKNGLCPCLKSRHVWFGQGSWLLWINPQFERRIW